MNSYQIYTDQQVIVALMKADPSVELEWLGGLSREEQREVMDWVVRLCGNRQVHNLGAKGALELAMKLKRYLANGGEV